MEIHKINVTLMELVVTYIFIIEETGRELEGLRRVKRKNAGFSFLPIKCCLLPYFLICACLAHFYSFGESHNGKACGLPSV